MCSRDAVGALIAIAIAIAGDPDAGVRVVVASALKLHAGPGAIPTLRRLAVDDEPRVSRAAASALERQAPK